MAHQCTRRRARQANPSSSTRVDRATHVPIWDATRKAYRDQLGAFRAERSEPCGYRGLGSYRLIDDLISDALGIDRAPE